MKQHGNADMWAKVMHVPAPWLMVHAKDLRHKVIVCADSTAAVRLPGGNQSGSVANVLQQVMGEKGDSDQRDSLWCQYRVAG